MTTNLILTGVQLEAPKVSLSYVVSDHLPMHDVQTISSYNVMFSYV